MNGLAKGIAHVSFAGGGAFLPVRCAYDRQMLIEHVGDRARAKGHVQVLLGNQRWIVRRSRDRSAAPCAVCGGGARSVCSTSGLTDVVYCLHCALGRDVEPLCAEDASGRMGS